MSGGEKKEEVSTVSQDESNTQKFLNLFRLSFKIHTLYHFDFQLTTIDFSDVDVAVARKEAYQNLEGNLTNRRVQTNQSGAGSQMRKETTTPAPASCLLILPYSISSHQFCLPSTIAAMV
ncbi:hypothetical protein D6D01_01248 [Aureobasidium pullulans]|uniref:Uncharacterized protein n=1 Tax=Aureobasidium pullulans TaxID=5580 RepID=A0A4S9LZG7_AURPU|nr:hypothetical protein D6D01_01248 [Aureobasidium pullulans]